MSYDVSVGRHASFNYTYNLAKLFHVAIPAINGERGGLYSLDGLTGSQAATLIGEGFKRLDRDFFNEGQRDRARGVKAFCSKYDAPNGWGSTVGALIFLGQLLAACAKHPRSRVRVL